MIIVIFVGCKVPSVVAVLCVVPSGGLVLHIGITPDAPFPLGQKCPRKMTMIYDLTKVIIVQSNC